MNNSEEILIVDDNPANLKLLSQMLADQGYAVRAVRNGKRALESVEVTIPDLVLLDIRMPVMDGYQVCQKLKNESSTRDVPVIFISALHDTEDKVQGFSVGGVDYITKPFQIEEVLARVETHLALRRYQKQLQTLNERYAQELALAGDLQTNFIPSTSPAIDGFEIGMTLRPALETSGDFYDLFPLSNGRFGILIADVVDKGAAAALLMALCRTLIRSHADEHPDQPEQVLAATNSRMLSDAGASRFVTVFFGALDPSSGVLSYCNAGHNPPELIRNATPDRAQSLNKTGVPLGILEDQEWACAELQMDEGDVLVLYTDGVTEAQATNAEFYGTERLVEVVRSNRHKRAEEINTKILGSIERFRGESPPRDDMAILVVKRTQS